ncbi:hypothetical protein PHMEG_0009778 [Phytophthora megakarya]|uniref:Uncharacterized protein n=1 Tax=Phytophthora megakarya TaxID=4795 RepID=A0A225WFE4_9STRA|nr:hypothetical protein PHMEG_0009778 [Phytophthora megakarya]
MNLGRNFIHKQLPTTCVGSKKKEPKSGKKNLKAPDSDAENRNEQTWTEEELAQIFHKKDLFAV